MQHFSKNIYNQPAALVPVCGGCVFGATQCWWDASGGVARRTIAAFGGFCVACGGFLAPPTWKEKKKHSTCVVGGGGSAAVVRGDAASSTCRIASVAIHFLWATFHPLKK